MADRQHAFDYEELLAHGRGELPGQMDARLPAPPMLMFNRITHIDDTGGDFGKGLVRAELDVNPDLWFFKCHFIGDPVMPGCLGLDAVWQMTGFFLGWIGQPGKGRAPLYARPGDEKVVALADPGAVAELKACRRDACRVSGEGIDGWIPKVRIWGVGKTEVFSK